ncbi:MAG TPA: GNAT family N-acetyltransferase [Longimicrobiaceae bacterium]|nr:GNAT family N-acetyltransferase [Longimicrobiaceae bacterium]
MKRDEDGEAETFDRFTRPVEVVIRTCREDDLEGLEWFGMFTPHREIIHEAFAMQRRGENLMLVAEANRFPVGQAWINLRARALLGTGLLWAVRVLPPFQGMGIGSRLLAAAEEALRARGFARAEIGVEKDNPDARRLYERVGYRVVREEYEEYEYTTPEGTHHRVPVDQWFLQKELSPRGADPGGPTSDGGEG